MSSDEKEWDFEVDKMKPLEVEEDSPLSQNRERIAEKKANQGLTLGEAPKRKRRKEYSNYDDGAQAQKEDQLIESLKVPFLQRALAYLIDNFMFSIFCVIVIYACTHYQVAAMISLPEGLVQALQEKEGTQEDFSKNLNTIIGVLIGWMFYYWLPMGLSGRSLGKKVLGIRIVQCENYRTPGLIRGFLRESLGKGLSYIFLIGFLIALFNKKGRTLHDFMFSTEAQKD